MSLTQIFKLSGNLVDSGEQLRALSQLIASAQAQGYRVIVVHGGGKQINALSKALGVPVTQIQGRRVTDADTIDILAHTIAGSVNLNIVSVLRSVGLQAMGLTGVDANITTATRRPPIPINGTPTDFGLVGELEDVDVSVINLLLDNEIVPVIGCLTWSAEQGVLNINADTFANRLALAANADSMTMLMEPDQVWGQSGTPLSSLSEIECAVGIQEGWISEGMIPKLSAGFSALSAGIRSVVLGSPIGLLAGKSTILTRSVEPFNG
jgi:acetylglutamate kinase